MKIRNIVLISSSISLAVAGFIGLAIGSINPKVVNAAEPDKIISNSSEFVEFRNDVNTGKNQYDFITVDELANQLSAVVMQKDVVGIINCCTGKPMSLAERVEQFTKEHNLDIKLEYGAFPDRPYDSPCEYGDATKINMIIEQK